MLAMGIVEGFDVDWAHMGMLWSLAFANDHLTIVQSC